MALVWTKKKRHTVYELRTAGKTLRLYTNGIFHSQFNPTSILSGHLWDLLFLPVFFKHSAPKNALILGVGGGAAIKKLNHYFPNCSVDGIDLDATHLYIAKRFFKCKSNTTALIEADATEYIQRNNKRYDFIIEDIFCGDAKRKDGAFRSVTADDDWLKKLRNALRKGGVLAINMESLQQARVLKRTVKLKDIGFASSFIFTTDRYENAIVILLPFSSSVSNYMQNLAAFFGERKAQKTMAPFKLEKL